MTAKTKINGHKRAWNKRDNPEMLPSDMEYQKQKEIRRVNNLIQKGKIIIGTNINGDIIAEYYGKNYSNSVNNALQKARKEYHYPSTNQGMGAKKVAGQQYLASLMADEIWKSTIPRELKIALTQKAK
jgi:hypothetical protein